MGKVDNSAAAKFLRNLREQLPDRFAAALRQEAEIEATECKKATPVDTGALRASIHVEGPHRDGRRVYAEIVAGGPTAPYAQTVHEDLEAHHPQGGAKFIEYPLRDSAPYMAERIAERIKINKGPEAPE